MFELLSSFEIADCLPFGLLTAFLKPLAANQVLPLRHHGIGDYESAVNKPTLNFQ
jgi:hypothetical protein